MEYNIESYVFMFYRAYTIVKSKCDVFKCNQYNYKQNRIHFSVNQPNE